jgi:hypothetical protein
MPYEKNQVLRREVSRVPSVCLCARLDNLKRRGQSLTAWTRGGTYKLYKLAPNDIFYQIYCLREWFLYLTENEHLQRNKQTKTVGKPCSSLRV